MRESTKPTGSQDRAFTTAAGRPNSDDVTTALAGLIHSVASELAEPIDKIMVATSRARVPNLPYEHVLQLNEVESSAAALVTIINGLGDLANAWKGELELEKVSFSIRGLVHDAIAAVAPHAAIKSIRLTSSIATDLEDTLVGDPGRLRDVVVRLLRSAVDGPEGGSAMITVSGVETANRAVSVRFDIKAANTGRHQDNSLSHMLTTAVVSAMGGQLWTDDDVTSHFVVELGVGEIDRPDQPDVPTPVPANLPVLIISDSAEDRRTLLGALGAAGMAPIAVSHPTETPASWREDDTVARAAVIYGSEDPFVVAEMFLDETRRTIPVTLVVPSGRRGDAARCRSLGIAGYLAMPIVSSDLADTVTATVQTLRSPGASSLITRHWLREGRSSLQVLLVDPSPISQRLAMDILEPRGHAVTAVADGDAAVAALSDSSFDVVIVEMGIPSSAGGQDAATVIRSTEVGAQIPLVAITAYSEQADPVRLQTVGRDHRLAKPWRPDELIVAIENAAAGATV